MKLFCRDCKRSTNHDVLHTIEKEEHIEEIGEGVEQIYYMVQCRGCETVCLHERYWYSEDRDPYTGNPSYHYYTYPDPFEEKNLMSETHYLPENIGNIYREAVAAYNKKLPILTSIALRTIIEAICVERGVADGNLKKKIDKLLNSQLITPQQAEVLHLNRYMGNASAHELAKPLEEELITGMDIIESLLINTYILPVKAKHLKTGIPKRTNPD